MTRAPNNSNNNSSSNRRGERINPETGQPWDGNTERRARAGSDNVPPHDHPNLTQQIRSMDYKLDDHILEVRDMHKDMRKAFLKDEDGEIDFEGHRRFHAGQKNSTDGKKEMIKTLLDKVLGSVAVAVLIWICTAAWQHFVTQLPAAAQITIPAPPAPTQPAPARSK